MLNNEEKQIAKSIQSKYLPKTEEKSEIEKLISLDKKVKSPALIFAYTFGIAGILIFGLGLSLALKVIGNLTYLGITIGVIGLVMICVNYSMYSLILNSRKRKYGSEIIKTSSKLLND